MDKITPFICLALTMFTCLAASPGKIIVADDKAYPPYSYLDDSGNPRGITIDLWNLWSKKTGIPVEFSLMKWSDALDAVANGKADAMGGLFDTPKRRALFDYTPALFQIPSSIFFHQQIMGIKGLQDLSGFTVGAVKGDQAEETIRTQYPKIKLQTFAGADTMIASALEGEIKVFVADDPIAFYYLSQNPKGNQFRRATESLILNLQYSAVRKNNTNLLHIVENGFKQIQKSEIEHIVNEWTGDAVPTALPWKKIGISFTLMACVAGVFFFWNLHLRRRVAAATASIAEQNRQLILSRDALAQSEKKYKALVEHSSDIIWSLDKKGAIHYVSPSCKRILGLEAASLTGASILDLLHPDDAQAFKKQLDELIDKKTGSTTPEFRIRHKDSTWRWQVASGSPMANADDALDSFVLVSRDITDKKKAGEEKQRLQAQLVQAQKMESIGRLAGGVAHDFNNMLQAIMGHTDQAIMQLDKEHPLREDLEEVHKAAERSANLTQQLLAFSRQQPVVPKVLDLNNIITGTLRMLQRLIGEEITLMWQPANPLWAVEIDPTQVDQMLINLCVNARDAIGGTGQITIETKNTAVDAAYCAANAGAIAGDYVMVSVSDTGCGMRKEVLDKVFEPFFTTKENGKGTGLGLATVYGIVTQNKGFLNVYSEPGQGTVFKIFLPRLLSGKTETQAKQKETTELGKGEGILVVEDDPTILNLSKTMLERLGYTAFLAGNAEEAIGLAEKQAGKIRLLITDVIMPGMNGKELSDKIRSSQPGIVTLFMSGYTSTVIGQKGILEKSMHFIQKPFNHRDLGKKIRELLK